MALETPTISAFLERSRPLQNDRARSTDKAVAWSCMIALDWLLARQQEPVSSLVCSGQAISVANKRTQRTSLQHCERHPDRQKKSLVTRQRWKTLDRERERKLAQIPNSRIFLCVMNWLFYRARHLRITLKEMDVICCNCDFVYGPTLRLAYNQNPLQLNPDPAGF